MFDTKCTWNKRNSIFDVTGLGLGFNSLSGHVMVNAYFHKRRGIAVGIVSSGAGFGVFVCAPLLQYLIKTYAWQGAVLIFSGIMAQFCVCAVLMRPLQAPRRRPVLEQIVVAKGNSDRYEDQKQCDNQQLESLLQSEESQTEKYSEIKPDIEFRTMNEDIDEAPKVKGKRGRGLHGWFMSTVNVSKPWADISVLKSLPNISTQEKACDKSNERFEKLKTYIAENGANGQSTYSHIYNQKYEPLLSHTHGQPKKHFQPLRRKDIFYSGSLHHLPEFQKAESISSFMHSMIIPTDESSLEDDADCTSVAGPQTTVSKLLKRCAPKKNSLCDMSIFRNSVYVPMLLGGVFIQMGQFIPSTFIPKYCEIIGLDKDQVSTILSIFGKLRGFADQITCIILFFKLCVF